MHDFPGSRCIAWVLRVCMGFFLGLSGGALQAQVVTEFSAGITAGARPDHVATGPDGNLWFTEPGANRIGRITPSGVITEFGAGITADAGLGDITSGPDGNLWFTEGNSDRIGRITPSGVVTEFGLNVGAAPVAIAAGPDGNLWFTESGANRVGRITRFGIVTEFSAGITAGAQDLGIITAGPDGNLWFTEQFPNRIGRITPSGVVTEFSAGITAGSRPNGITAGPDGNLWFTETGGNRIGRITPSGVVTEFSAGIHADANPVGITAGPDGNLWFTEYFDERIGRITPLGVVTEFSAGITAGATLRSITAGPDGNLWFTEGSGNRIGRLTVTTGLVSIYIPSTAHASGANGAFYTTDLTVSNPGSTSVSFTLKFLGHDQDGTSGPQQTFTLGPGQTRTFPDVLGSVFSLASGYGAIQISSSPSSVIAVAQTSTPGFGGTFGQSVPAADGLSFISHAYPGSIAAVREDASFRTNLILCNETAAALDLDVALVGADGSTLGAKRYSLPPFGMTQVTRVVRDLGVAANTTGARLDLSTAASQGAFAAYASVIDNVTNDPRTLLPVRPSVFSPLGYNWYVPSSAHSAGANGAFYTTDVTISNQGASAASFTLQFFGHDQDGTSGPKQNFNLAAGLTATYADVLGTVFGQTSAYGALAVQSPSSGGLVVLAQTSTPGFGGTFGQSVPAARLVSSGSPSSILGVREDAAFRTNLILYNSLGTPGTIDITLVANDGTTLASKRYAFLPFEMIQVSRVVRDLGVSGDVSGARLVLSPVGAAGQSAFASYASVIDNVTNDPRTLLTQ